MSTEDAGSLTPENDCPQTCLNRLAESCVIHRPSTEKEDTAKHYCGQLQPHAAHVWQTPPVYGKATFVSAYQCAGLSVDDRVADAADAAAERFMQRYRQRPNGDGERLYDLYDALSTLAAELRSSPGKTTSGEQP